MNRLIKALIIFRIFFICLLIVFVGIFIFLLFELGQPEKTQNELVEYMSKFNAIFEKNPDCYAFISHIIRAYVESIYDAYIIFLQISFAFIALLSSFIGILTKTIKILRAERMG